VAFGGRGILNRLETALINPLARKLFDRKKGDANIRVVGVRAPDEKSDRYEVLLDGE
jgi:hypothetical protein